MLKSKAKKSSYRWWQVRSTDFALFLYAVIFQRILLTGMFVYGATFADDDEKPLSYILDLPIAGHHPIKMLSAIIVLMWVYFTICFFTALFEKCYSKLKLALLFMGIFYLLGVATRHFMTVFPLAI